MSLKRFIAQTTLFQCVGCTASLNCGGAANKVWRCKLTLTTVNTLPKMRPRVKCAANLIPKILCAGSTIFLLQSRSRLHVINGEAMQSLSDFVAHASGKISGLSR